MLLLIFFAALGVTFIAHVARTRHTQLKLYANHDVAAMRSDLAVFLKRGYDGAVLTFEDVVVHRSVYFRKYITELSDYGLFMELPRKSMTREEFLELKCLLNQCAEDDEQRWAVDECDDAFRIDFRQDIDAATRWSATIFTRLFGRTKVNVRVWAVDVCPVDDLAFVAITHARSISCRWY